MTEERRSRATEAFFGRRKGKPLRNQQVDTIENLLPLLKIDLESAPPQNLAALFPADVRSIRLEIGFGG
jgi:tRNA (guanine-N7-)-methyltransferase